MKLIGFPLHWAQWQWQPGTHDPNPPVNLEDVGATGTASGSISFTGDAAGTVALTGAGAGDLAFTGTAVGTVALAGSGAGDIGFTGLAEGTVASSAISGVGAGDLGFTGLADGTASGGVAPIIIRADDAPPSWKKRFYDKQLKEFEDSLEEIVAAEDPQDVAQEAIEAFRPIETSAPAIAESSQAIVEALRGLARTAMTRKELQAEIAAIRAETAAIAAYRRKKRNNEAALLLLM